jgi:hypothetical protein
MITGSPLSGSAAFAFVVPTDPAITAASRSGTTSRLADQTFPSRSVDTDALNPTRVMAFPHFGASPTGCRRELIDDSMTVSGQRYKRSALP